MCELMIQKIISKFHLIHIIAMFSVFFVYSHGLDFDDHGFFNLLGISGLLIIGNINKFGCRIRKPKYCPYKLMKYFLDITEKAGIKCGNSSNTKKKILKYSKSKYINDTTQIIGFPNSNDKIFWSNKSNLNKTISTILSENLIDMENNEILKTIKKENLPEIVVDFSDNKDGKMIINLHLYFCKIFSISFFISSFLF